MLYEVTVKAVTTYTYQCRGLAVINDLAYLAYMLVHICPRSLMDFGFNIETAQIFIVNTLYTCSSNLIRRM